jgi:hypothetical protein
MMLAGLFVAAAPGAAQDTTHNGLGVTVSHLERSDIVPLGDCPPGENIVRGVIRAGDEANEFVTVHLDFKVLDGFQGVDWPRPSIHDVNGRRYRTAQVFSDMDREPEYSCNFSFRVPDGMNVKEFLLDEGVALDLTAHDR